MVRNGFKVHDPGRDKWYLMVAKTPQVKQRWLKAFSDERRRVHDDMVNSKCDTFFLSAFLFVCVYFSVYSGFETEQYNSSLMGF
jgi:hypothetical protein